MATQKRNDSDTVSFGAFSGLRNDVDPIRFAPSDLEIGDNIDIDKSGAIRRRAGRTRRYATPAHSLWASDTLALFISGTNLNRLNADYTATPLRTDLTLGMRMDYCEVNDRVYFANGVNTGIYERSNDTVRSWGLPVPALPSTAVVGGDMAPGTYQFTLTYERADGQESGAALAGTVTVGAGQAVKFAVPAGPAEVSKKNLYLSTPNGDMLYRVATLTNATTVYTASAADVAALATPLKTQFLNPPPAGQLVAYYKGRMYVAVDATLYPSEPFAYELFDWRKFIPADAKITMLAVIEDRNGAAEGLFIGTEKSTGVLIGDSPENFAYVPKTDYGSILGALDYVEGALFGDNSLGSRLLPMWLSTQGICVGLPNMEIANLTRTKYSVSMSGVGAALFIPGVNRFIAVSGSDPAYVVHTETMALWTYSNFTVNRMARFNNTYLASTANGIYELVGNLDDAAPIIATVRFGQTDFNTAFLKRVDRTYLGYSAADVLSLRALVDGQTFTYPVLQRSALEHGERVKLGRGLKARYWQFELSNPTGADFTLDRLDVQPIETLRRVGGSA